MNDRICLGFFVLLIGILGCSNNLETIEEYDELGYTERYQRNKETLVKEGAFRRYNPEGQLVELATYRSDTLVGQRILFTDQGDTLIVENYRGGVFEGPYRKYFEDLPQVQQKGQFTDGRMEGTWTSYYSNGELRERVAFANNQEEGPFREWHDNGKLKAEGTYRNGDNEDGELRLYDENGNLERIMQCDMGVCRTTWTPEQGPASE